MSEAHVGKAFAPEAFLGILNGIPIVATSVHCTATGVVVDLRCRENDVTRALDAEYEAAFDAWVPQARLAEKRGVRPVDPPEQPGEFLMNIPLRLTDDVGTPYRASSKQAAGTGTEWEGRWTYKPAVPAAARRLTLALDLADWSDHARTLLL